MKIDFHTHIYPDRIAGSTLEKLAGNYGLKPYTDATVSGLKASMEEAGVHISVVLPVITRAGQVQSINRCAREVTPEAFDHSVGQILSFGAVHPLSEHYKEELKMVKALGLKGIKLHPEYQQLYIDDISMLRLISYASELGLVIVIHSGSESDREQTLHCLPRMARRMLHEVQPKKLVLAHLGGFREWEETMEYLAGENVWLDTGFVAGHMPADQVEMLIRAHGADRILMASDSPWNGQKDTVDFINGLSLTEKEKQMIFSENALGLLGLTIHDSIA